MARVTANTFRLLGMEPRMGRQFLEEEDAAGRDRVVMLSDSLWRRRFHADPAMIGRKITLDGNPYVVVAVLPAGFRFPRQRGLGGTSISSKTDIYKPLGYTNDDLKEKAGDFNYATLARLRPGVTREQALAELNVVQASIAATLEGEEKMELRALVTPLQAQMVGGVRQTLFLIMGAVGAVLLVLCVNLANLSLVRAAVRARDAAVRAALGAGRGQLVRQALAESLLLAGAGGALGIAVAWWGVAALLKTAPVELPRANEVHIDGVVLGFAFLLSLVTGISFGMFPALRSAAADPQDALRSSSRGTTEAGHGRRLRNTLVALEVGLSAVLLITAGLLLGSFARLMNVDKGFHVDRVLALDLALPSARYSGSSKRSEFYERLMAKARALPGVTSVSIVSALPLQGETWIDVASTLADQRPFLERPAVNVRFISPDYFQTLRIPLQEGRTFANQDRSKLTAIISNATAQRLWPGEKNIVGRTFRHGAKPVELVGVTPDIRGTDLDKDPVMMLYLPYWQQSRFSASLLVRTAMDPRGIAAAVRSAVWQVDREVPVPEMRTLQQVMDESVAQRRFQATLILLFAAAALALAGIGIYGVVAYSVARRRNEIGIRLALGAAGGDVQRMVLRQGMMPALVGLAAGIAVALAIGQALHGMLFRMSARDPLTIGAVAAVLTLVAVAACAVPARRATRMDPARTLRFD